MVRSPSHDRSLHITVMLSLQFEMEADVLFVVFLQVRTVNIALCPIPPCLL